MIILEDEQYVFTETIDSNWPQNHFIYNWTCNGNTNNPSFGLTSDQSQIRELASRIVNLLLCAVGDPLSFIDIVPETT